MKPARSLIPIGTVALLPQTAQYVRQLEGQLLTHLSQWGYQEIIPPTFEYLDVLSAGLPGDILEKSYKFADWTTGRILVLRPDVTAQVARIVAMGMGGVGLPLRFSYRTTVFRYEPDHVGRDRELFQLGVELIGADTPEMDVEILSLLIESLKKIGLPKFQISVGHVGFYKALLAQSGLSETGRKQAELAAARKDLPRLEEILSQERLSSKRARTLLEMPSQFGGEDVLEWGRKVAGRHSALTQPLERLAQVYHLLDLTGAKEHVSLDLGEFRRFDYYDGLVFDVFTETLGCELGGGGRYNHLIGRFGCDLPSTGFALDLNHVFSALKPLVQEVSGRIRPLLLAAPGNQFGRAFHLAQCLRREGLQVIQETMSVSRSSFVRSLADRAQGLAVTLMVILGAPAVPSDSVLVVRLRRGSHRQQTNVTLSDLPAFLKAQSL